MGNSQKDNISIDIIYIRVCIGEINKTLQMGLIPADRCPFKFSGRGTGEFGIGMEGKEPHQVSTRITGCSDDRNIHTCYLAELG
jgi:hypothetical protein